MPRRPSAYAQAQLEQMLRAAERATGRPHYLRARPDGSIDVLPLEPAREEPPLGPLTAAPLAPALGDLPEPVL